MNDLLAMRWRAPLGRFIQRDVAIQSPPLFFLSGSLRRPRDDDFIASYAPASGRPR